MFYSSVNMFFLWFINFFINIADQHLMNMYTVHFPVVVHGNTCYKVSGIGGRLQNS